MTNFKQLSNSPEKMSADLNQIHLNWFDITRPPNNPESKMSTRRQYSEN